MKNYKFVIEVLIKLGIILILILAASMEHQYTYYIFVRWSVTFAFIYFIYKSFIQEQIGLVIYYFAAAILFNPFRQFTFQKETWHLFDYLIATMTFLTIIVDWSYLKKNNYRVTN